MKTIEMNNNKKELKPKTFYDELAEFGVLGEYLKTYFPEKYKNDENFRDEMIKSLIKHSDKNIPELEIHYLEKLCESLEFFVEYNLKWKNRKS